MINDITYRIFISLLLLVAVASVVQSQFPRFEFGDDLILVNNSYIPDDIIGEVVNDSLQCVTSNTDCCINGQGNWYDEREIIVEDSDMISRGDGVVYLNHKANESLLGLWRCDTPDHNNIIQSIYIYLGSQTRGKFMSAKVFFTLESEPNSLPTFTLTCRSEGGPVTTVMWVKNGIPLHETNISYTTSQIITNTSSNTVYNNTLSIKGREYGTYNCTISNNIRDFISDVNDTFITGNILVKVAQTPSNLSVIYKSSTSVLLEVSYDIPTTTQYTYSVYYHSQNITYQSFIRKNSHLLTDLPTEGIHSISLVATADNHLPSNVVGPVNSTVEPPLVSITENGSKVDTTPYNLTCRVTLPSGVHVESESISIRLIKLKYYRFFTPPLVYNDGSYTVTLSFTSVKESNEGKYKCIANYSLSIFTSPVVLSNVLYLNVIPRADFTLRIKSLKNEVINGSNVLVCYFYINHYRRMVDFHMVMNITWTDQSGKIYTNEQIVTQKPVDERSNFTPDHEGNYTCTVQMFVDEALIRETEETIQFIQPLNLNTLSVDVTGSRLYGLVGISYTLACTVTLSSRIMGSHVYIDCEGPGLSSYQHTDTSDDTIIVHEVHIEKLKLSDEGIYTCIAYYENPIATNGSGNMFLNILKPVKPVRPEHIESSDISTQSVTIQWTVAYISYSPEHYVVLYDTDMNNLTQNTSSNYSGDDMNIRNVNYSVELKDLKAETIYYVQVVAINTANKSTRSMVESFTTTSLPTIQTVSGDTTSNSTQGFDTVYVIGGIITLLFIILIIGVTAFGIILRVKSFHNAVTVVSTTSNEAYGVISHKQQEEHDYEMVGPPSVGPKRHNQKQIQHVEEPVYDVIA